MINDRFGKKVGHLFVLGLLIGMLPARAANAVCTAAEIIAQAPGCPASSAPCLIDREFTIENGCTLDFGTRAVSLARKMTIGSGLVTIKAGSFTVIDRAATFIDGKAARGGTIVIQTTGNFTTLGRSDAINVDAVNVGGSCILGGNIIIEAGGEVSLEGDLFARGTCSEATGGDITIRAGGSFSNSTQSLLSAEGGSASSGGGSIAITTGGAATLRGQLSVRGSDGGSVDLVAQGAVLTTAVIDVSPLTASDAGSGGEVNIEGSEVRISGEIDADGDEGEFQSGGCGGFVDLFARAGDVIVAADVTADGANPDGSGGEISIAARKAARIERRVSARARGTEGCGGGICIDADVDIQLTAAGSVISSCGGTGAGGEGGGAGGDVEFLASRQLDVNGLVDVAGKNNDTTGGTVSLTSGVGGSGPLTVTNIVDAQSGGCGLEFCGLGGSIDLAGCDVTVSSTGRLLASGAEEAGENSLVAREQLRIAGIVRAEKLVPTGIDGTNLTRFPSRKPPIVTGTVAPAATQESRATCVFQGQTNPPCLDPCPTCGDDQRQFPETCDDGNNLSCDGCSLFCQVEECADDNVCTIDSCDPDFGCLIEPIPGCTVPPTATPTATPTLTPTATRTPLPCVGDCNDDGSVSINELVVGVNIALGEAALTECPSFDFNKDDKVTIDELLLSVRAALQGCG